MTTEQFNKAQSIVEEIEEIERSINVIKNGHFENYLLRVKVSTGSSIRLSLEALEDLQCQKSELEAHLEAI